MLVASIESLAQSEDETEFEWSKYDAVKRSKIDRALESADTDTCRRVREAMLEIEKPGAGRKFREFCKANLLPTFFREEADGVESPLSKPDLEQLLREAYSIRSNYIHRLNELPDLLKLGAVSGEWVRTSRKTQLTIRGLARLARHLILGYVDGYPKKEKELYNYARERYGIVHVELASEYWIGNSNDLKLSDGVRRLEGFLTQLSAYLSNVENASLTDLRSMLLNVEPLMEQGTQEKRRAFLALYLLFNVHVTSDQRMENLQEVESKYLADTEVPSVEMLLVYMLVQQEPDWTLSDFEQIIETYFAERNTNSGLRLPRTFEAGVLVYIAEQYRRAGDIEHVKEKIANAIECHPGHESLHQLENSVSLDTPIEWREMVFPQPSSLGARENL